MRAAATAWRLQAMAQAFRRWHLDTHHWRQVKQTLSCIGETTAEALVSVDFKRCVFPITSMIAVPLYGSTKLPPYETLLWLLQHDLSSSVMQLDLCMGCDRWKVYAKEHAVRKAFQTRAAQRWRNIAAAAAFSAWQSAVAWRRHILAATVDASAHWQRRVLTEV